MDGVPALTLPRRSGAAPWQRAGTNYAVVATHSLQERHMRCALSNGPGAIDLRPIFSQREAQPEGALLLLGAGTRDAMPRV